MTTKKKPDARPRSGKHLHAGVLLRAPDDKRELWTRAARLAGLPRAEWAVGELNAAAARQTRRHAEQAEREQRHKGKAGK